MGDEDAFFDRVKYYFCVSNPLHLFADEKKIKEATDIQKDKKASGAQKEAAKCLLEATQDNGQDRPLVTRLAAQAPIKMLTLGGMLAYYNTVPQIVFWQWLHQSLTSYIDYRKNDPEVPECELALAYTASTAGAVTTALVLHKYMRCSSPLTRRFIPLGAVAVGNAINIAMIKRRAMKEGVTVYLRNGRSVGVSKAAGFQSMVGALIGRLLHVAPALVVTPLVLNSMEKKNKFCKTPWLEAAYALGVTGLMLFLLSPFVWALYGYKTPTPTKSLEEDIRKKAKNENVLYYYNK